MRSDRHILFWLVALIAVVVIVGLLREVLLPFVLGLLLAYFFNPLVDGLTDKGLGRIAGSALIVAGLIGSLAMVVLYVVPVLAVQLAELARTLPADLERLGAMIEAWARLQLGDRFAQVQSGLAEALKTAADNWAGLAGWLAGELWSRGQVMIQILAVALVTPLVMFYVLIDWHAMLQKIDALLPRDQAATIRAIASEIDEAISAFIRGQGVVCFILGLYYSSALSIAGLDYALLVGVGTGILSFIPFVGWATGLLTASVLAVMQSWPDLVLLGTVVAIFLGAQALDAGFLSPKIVGSKIGLHPVWLILALFVFSYLFGFVGTLVAVPVAAALGVLVRFAVKLYLQSDVYKGHDPVTEREHIERV